MQEDELCLLQPEVEDFTAADVVNSRNRKWTVSSGAQSSRLLTAFLTAALLAIFSLLALLLLVFRNNTELRQLLANQSFRPIDTVNHTAYIPGNHSSLTSSPGLTPLFRRHPLVADLDCGRLLINDNKYIKYATKRRISYKDDPVLPMSCESIRQRNYFPAQPLSNVEEKFPIAFSRTVFEDYLFLESEFAASYAPQNWFCFAIDDKSNEVFRARVHTLASCFPNVLVTHNEYKMDSAGHNMSFSHLECMKMLSQPARIWNYLLLLQNHDVALKTNQELVQILTWFQGANDIEAHNVPVNRVNYSLDWTFKHLHLFRNATHNIPLKDPSPKLQFAKGLVESALCRPAVEFMLNQLDLTIILRQLETGEYGIDEILLPTLHTTDVIGFPGGFTHECLDKGIETGFVSRWTIWVYHPENCMSQKFRHSICIFGVEDLWKNMNENGYLFANKLMPEFDFGAISCWHETIFNRTHRSRGVHRLKPNMYQQLPPVRYHTENLKSGKVNMDTFDCYKKL